jgi:hypothetical protein
MNQTARPSITKERTAFIFDELISLEEPSSFLLFQSFSSSNAFIAAIPANKQGGRQTYMTLHRVIGKASISLLSAMLQWHTTA